MNDRNLSRKLRDGDGWWSISQLRSASQPPPAVWKWKPTISCRSFPQFVSLQWLRWDHNYKVVDGWPRSMDPGHSDSGMDRIVPISRNSTRPDSRSLDRNRPLPSSRSLFSPSSLWLLYFCLLSIRLSISFGGDEVKSHSPSITNLVCPVRSHRRYCPQ